MDLELQRSLLAAEKEFKEGPMKNFYYNKLGGYPSRLRMRKVLEALGDVENKKVIDVGCEAGHFSLRILDKNPAKLYSIDICQEALDEYKRKLKEKPHKAKTFVKRAFLQDMPFEDNSFDAMICTEVIEHAPYIEKGFSEMSRVLKKNGRLVLTFPNEKLRRVVYPFVKILGIKSDVVQDTTLFDYNPNEIKKMLEKHFIVRKYTRIPWFFPMTNFMICQKK